jgi:hypothetical protein
MGVRQEMMWYGKSKTDSWLANRIYHAQSCDRVTLIDHYMSEHACYKEDKTKFDDVLDCCNINETKSMA